MVISVSNIESIVKIEWNRVDEWGGTLLTLASDTFKRRPLHVGDKIEIEVTDKRKCTGYIDSTGRVPCYDFKSLESGNQCYHCRSKDIMRDYIEGRSGSHRTGKHSVYLVQIGENLKVGVTKTRRLTKRWVEQGAVYATELVECESAEKALQIESNLSDTGLSERINKISKSVCCDSPELLKNKISDLSYSGEIVDVQSMTMYQSPSEPSTIFREGELSGKIESVRGQLIFTDSQCLAVTEGRCVRQSKQHSLSDF